MEIQSIKYLEVLHRLLSERKQHLMEERLTLANSANAGKKDPDSIIIRMALLNEEELGIINEIMDGISHELKRR